MKRRILWQSVLCALAVVLPAFSQTLGVPQKSLSVAYPGKSWTLKIDSPDFAISQNELQPNGQEYLLAENSRLGVTLSVTLEKVDGRADISDCRATLQKRLDGSGPFKITNPKTREINGVPVVEYLIPQANGVPVQQGNLFACMVKDDVYIDMHLSKVQFQQKDEPLFEAILRASLVTTTEDTGSSSGNSRAQQLFVEGTRAYLQNKRHRLPAKGLC